MQRRNDPRHRSSFEEFFHTFSRHVCRLPIQFYPRTLTRQIPSNRCRHSFPFFISNRRASSTHQPNKLLPIKLSHPLRSYHSLDDGWISPGLVIYFSSKRSMLGIYDRPDDAGFSLARSSDDRPELSTPQSSHPIRSFISTLHNPLHNDCIYNRCAAPFRL